MFEVLAQLQSQIMQMPKDYQNYLEKMEEGYKKLNTEKEKKEFSSPIQITDENGIVTENSNLTESGGIKVRGTKGLMEGLRTILGAEIEVVNVEEEDPNAVVNAKRKAQIDSSRNVVVGEEDHLEIDEDLF